MGWTHLVHDCELPTRVDGRKVGADVGSIWECDSSGCGCNWEIIGYTPGDDYDWRRPQSGRRPQ